MTESVRARPTPYRSRRRRDRIVAAVIAVVAVAVAAVLYLTSDIRATEAVTADGSEPPTPMSTVPARLTAAWQQAADPEVGAAASPFGTVVTADQHTVTGRSAETGAVAWTYTRSNRDVCRIGTGDVLGGDVDAADISAADIDSEDGVRGIMTMYARDGMCQEMATLNPITGALLFTRTAPNRLPGTLIFGHPYAAWVSSDLMEIWRGSLVRTFQYGDQPAPTSANTRHLGCVFSDAAVGQDQFGTVEHCTDKGANARIVLNWTDPNHQNKDWDSYKTQVRADIDTGSPVARIVGITKDRVAVLVTEPTPAVLIYDADGKLATRTPVSIPAAAIVADTGITPRVTLDGVQYSFVGGNVISVGRETVQVTVPVTSSSGATTTPTSEAGFSNFLGTTGSSSGAAEPTTKTEDRDSLVVNWTMSEAIGLPALVGKDLVVPSPTGLAVATPAEGTVSRSIDVPRTGSPKRVDVVLVGDRLVELRGSEVVSLKAAS
ncbi:Rv3212 family protein [Nakamurella lactea]|uniref:Rv3212 family protein n=1 Tax=Nakamurella lactea TaxID=459515 RepID=UPI00048EA67F|nr:hypothetical protein [Nakamurella lactea]